MKTLLELLSIYLQIICYVSITKLFYKKSKLLFKIQKLLLSCSSFCLLFASNRSLQQFRDGRQSVRRSAAAGASSGSGRAPLSPPTRLGVGPSISAALSGSEPTWRSIDEPTPRFAQRSSSDDGIACSIIATLFSCIQPETDNTVQYQKQIIQ